MKAYPASQRLSKTEFNNLQDWETYPVGYFHCDKCKCEIEFKFADFDKHAFSEYSNLTRNDNQLFELFVFQNKLKKTNSFLDFYCPTCRAPVKFYFESWAGGNHGERGFSIKFIIE